MSAPLWGEARLLELLAAGLDGAPADEVELSARRGRIGTVRFAGSQPTQSTEADDVAIQVRAARGRRVGAARASGASAAQVREAVARAAEVARCLPERERWEGFAGAAPPRPVPDALDARTAASEAAERAALLGPVFAGAGAARLEAAGVLQAGVFELAALTSRGARAYHAGTQAKLEVIAHAGRASGYAVGYGRALGALDPAALAERAAADGAAMRDAVELPPGAYDVVLEPPAVAELLEWLAFTGLTSRSHEDGTSALAGRSGQQVTGERITLVDDALAGGAPLPAVPFDAEGTPRERVVLLERGRVAGALHDRASAARAGARSTGHATTPGHEEAADGAAALHLSLAPGTEPLDGLVAGLDRGLLVSRLHYVNGYLDPRRTLMTGLTRDGTFLIEGGRRRRGVRTLRFTDSLLEALARADGLSAARQAVPTWATQTLLGGLLVPAVRVRGLRFSGAQAG